MNLNELTIREAAAGLKSGEFNSVDLTRACLSRIKERNPEINAFISVAEETALSEAKRADKMIKDGTGGPLAGVPFAVKDAICTRGIRSTGAAKILDNYVPPFDATVIKKIREQGGVLLGKNNCDTFGHGASNENSMYGPVKNPHDLTKVAGGSSGGSAAAVADHQCIYAIAEDTGGSIREPASFCGIVGLRPSYGRNSRYGIMPMASSLDVVGPMTKTVADMALVAREIAGHDPKDATTVDTPVPDYVTELDKGLAGLTLGVPREYFSVDGLDDEVRKIIEARIDELKTRGATLKEVSLPHTKYATAVYYILVPSEDSSNLARLDGVRYGVRQPGRDLLALYANSRREGFPEEVKRRILLGTYALSAGYYDAYYKKAQQVRTLICRDFDEAFREVDALIAPTFPTLPFGIGEKINDVLSMYLSDILLTPAAIAGVPSISVPAGFSATGLPVGLQIIGPRLREDTVLQAAAAIAVN